MLEDYTEEVRSQRRWARLATTAVLVIVALAIVTLFVLR
jgi:hypothetical protein